MTNACAAVQYGFYSLYFARPCLHVRHILFLTHTCVCLSIGRATHCSAEVLRAFCT